MGLLDRAGARLTARPEDAEILVVNTCSFIDTAKQESVDTILEMARFKTAGSAKKLIVAGCLVERYRDEIRKNIPEVDAVVGTGELESILEAAGMHSSCRRPSPFNILSGNAPCQKFAQAGSRWTQERISTRRRFRPEGDLREQQGRFSRDEWQGAAHMLPTYLYDEDTPRLISTGRTSAYIKIAEGCDHPCTFCVIPNLRGKFRSRRFESVVAEAQKLVASGVQEITLIGQDTTCYGEDLGLKDGLALLLEALAAHRRPSLAALPLRLSQPHHRQLLETIAKHDNICKYLDVPLQHASPDVLKRMKRGAGADIFLKTLEKVRAAVPGIALRTSFIVGFPGESSADYRSSGSSSSARRNSTGSASSTTPMKKAQRPSRSTPKLSKRTIESRKRKLMKLQQKIIKAAPSSNGSAVNSWSWPKARAKRHRLLWEGRTEFHAPEIDGKVYINDFGELESLEAGKFYRAEITEAHDYDLVARIVAGPSLEPEPRPLKTAHRFAGI